jgi:exodeoxyribonuclease VII small subunit
MPPKKDPQTFESALARVEQIAARMEAGELPLDELLVTYEEGLRLIRFCSQRLDDAEKRLETITRDTAGQPLGIAPISGEIPSSTPPENPATEEDASGSGSPSGPARLF